MAWPFLDNNIKALLHISICKCVEVELKVSTYLSTIL